MVKFFLAIFWLQTCQTRPELGMAQIVCIYLKLDYSKIMVLVFTKLVSTLETKYHILTKEKLNNREVFRR